MTIVRLNAASMTGTILRKSSVGSVPITYFVYQPSTLVRPGKVLVLVHGISRNAAEHVEVFAPFADHHGLTLIAPLFEDKSFRGYQRLGFSRGKGKGIRSDHVLRKVLDQFSVETSIPTKRFYMFGHSGGGQFVHRYAMAHPTEVIGYGVSAAGWYTLPDLALEYPYGLMKPGGFQDLAFDVDRFLAIPACILVGEKDTERDEALNKADHLDATQGKTRRERAEYWAAAMTTAARWRGLGTSFDLFVLPNCGHDFRDLATSGGLADIVSRWLLGQSTAVENPSPKTIRSVTRRT